MDRLRVGDLVKACHQYGGQVVIGYIDSISKFNNDSVDECEYSLVWDPGDDFDDKAKDCQKYMPTSVGFMDIHVSYGQAWFRRQDIIEVIQPGYRNTGKQEETINKGKFSWKPGKDGTYVLGFDKAFEMEVKI